MGRKSLATTAMAAWIVLGCAAAGPDAAVYALCQEAVRDRLRTPATAQFPPRGDVVFQRGLPIGDVQLSSYVDAQNAFGALVRSQWTCIAEEDGEGGWHVLGVPTVW